MILLVEARERNDCAGAKSAAVCSTPLSGVGMSISDGMSLRDCGSIYRYICVVKRFALVGGVIQRVNGMRPSTCFVNNTSFYIMDDSSSHLDLAQRLLFSTTLRT